MRKRNLGPILDANGWAVNSKAKINMPFGASLTRVATLPPGAQRDLMDPFAEKERPWKTYTVLLVILLLALGWLLGKLDGFLPNALNSSRVLHGKPAAASPAAPEQGK